MTQRTFINVFTISLIGILLVPITGVAHEVGDQNPAEKVHKVIEVLYRLDPERVHDVVKHDFNNYGNRPHNDRNKCNGYEGGHSGYDVIHLKDAAAPFYSLTKGKVIQVKKPDPQNRKILSYIAVYNATEDKTIFYLHPSAIIVEKEQDVEVDTPLGEQGNTGNSSEPHIHLEVRKGWRQAPSCGIAAAKRVGSPNEEPIRYLYDWVKDFGGAQPPDDVIVKPIPNQRPNLVIESLQANQSLLERVENFRLTVTVKNEGTGQSPSTKLRYYKWDGTSHSWKQLDETTSVSSLAANRTSTEHETFTAPNTTGRHFYSVCVAKVLGETNLTDNCYASWVTITVQHTVQHTVQQLNTMQQSNQKQGYIYWTEDSSDEIQRSNLDGTNIEDLVTDELEGPRGIALDIAGGKMYWIDGGTDKIQRSNLNGTNIEDLVTDELGSPRGIALDIAGGKMYWTDSGTDKIQRSNLNGTNIEDLVTDELGSPRGIALDIAGGKMYWTDYSADKIQRSNLNGTNIEDLVTDELRSPRGIALDIVGGKMYWTDYSADKIQRSNLDGTNIEDLIVGVESAGIALDVSGGKMYWTDRGTDKIQRSNLDGTDIEDLVTDELRNPYGIALVISHSHLAAPTLNFPESALPSDSALLPNYPNPFNPETWIPYQLSELAEVTVTIYAADGRLIRTLALGHQSAGVYQNKSSAAYWDGRNDLGEPVASGVYFFTLTAGDFTATRKMLIRK